MSINEGIDSLASIIIPFLEGEVGISIGPGDFHDVLSIILNDRTLGDLIELYDDTRNDVMSLSGLNATELNLQGRMMSVFNLNFGGLTDEEVADLLIDSFTVYTTVTGFQVIRPEVRAAAYLGLSSAIFWKNWGGDTDDVIEAFIQVDLVGYLIGWMGAWLDDQGPNYSNSSEAQKARILKGVRTGVGASTLRMVAIGGSW